MPCLHDEPYAHLELFRPVLGNGAAVWFLSEPEHQLAHRLGRLPARHSVTGAGIDIPEDDRQGYQEGDQSRDGHYESSDREHSSTNGPHCRRTDCSRPPD